MTSEAKTVKIIAAKPPCQGHPCDSCVEEIACGTHDPSCSLFSRYQASMKLESKKDDLKLKSLSPIEEQLLSVLKDGPQTRDELVKKMAIPRTTIYDGLKKLIVRNEVRKAPVYLVERNRGRPQVLFSILDEKK